MVETIPQELELPLEELRKQVASLMARVEELERPAPVAPVRDSVPVPSPAAAEPRESITEQELLAISGALAAYLGVRVHIRQIRLISSRAWASEGRVTIQASHRLHSQDIAVKLNITIDQKTYEVDVEASEPEAPMAPSRGYAMEYAPVRVPAAPAAAVKPVEITPVNEGKVCRSPVSGIVVRAVTQAGQTLQVGDVLLILEAMKMETSVTSPVAGKVAAIKVAPGDSVQSGQVVVEFE